MTLGGERVWKLQTGAETLGTTINTSAGLARGQRGKSVRQEGGRQEGGSQAAAGKGGWQGDMFGNQPKDRRGSFLVLHLAMMH